nr:hypothetical protein [Raoultibacter phocaeensis]
MKAIESRSVTASPRAGGLLDRLALAGKRRLAYEQVLRLHDAHIGRNHVARCKSHDIAHHNLFDVDFALAYAEPVNAGCRGNHLEQVLGRTSAARLLHEAKRSRDDHHRGDDDHRRRISLPRIGSDDVGEPRHEGQHEQDGRKRVDERLDNALGQRGFLSFGDDVRTVLVAHFFKPIGPKPVRCARERDVQLVGIRLRGEQQPVVKLGPAHVGCADLLGVRLHRCQQCLDHGSFLLCAARGHTDCMRERTNRLREPSCLRAELLCIVAGMPKMRSLAHDLRGTASRSETSALRIRAR